MLFVDVKQFMTKEDGTRAYVWQTISASEALKLADPQLRCPECKGAVGLRRGSEDGAKQNRAEHKRKSPGCSMGDCFDGKRRLAGTAIEPDQLSVVLANTPA